MIQNDPSLFNVGCTKHLDQPSHPLSPSSLGHITRFLSPYMPKEINIDHLKNGLLGHISTVLEIFPRS